MNVRRYRDASSWQEEEMYTFLQRTCVATMMTMRVNRDEVMWHSIKPTNGLRRTYVAIVTTSIGLKKMFLSGFSHDLHSLFLSEVVEFIG
jgi:hypothetical protein